MSTEETKERTSEKLATAMAESGCSVELIRRARAFEFDDYKSESATPSMDLYAVLMQQGFPELAARVVKGEFDAQHWEADEWLDSEEGQSTMKNLGPLASLMRNH